MVDDKRASAIADVAAELARRSVGVPRSDVANLPIVLLERQKRTGNLAAAIAIGNPARMTFAMAASALGFVGDELPPLFESRASDYQIGVEIRQAYDAAMAAMAAESTAPSPAAEPAP